MKVILAVPAVLSAAFAASAVASAPAEAQFGRDTQNNVSVRERPRPGYEAQGVPFGAFTVRPEASLTGTYNDNIFAADDNPDPQFDDQGNLLPDNSRPVAEDFIIGAGLDVRMDTIWAVHRLAFDGSVDYLQYMDNDDESQVNGTAGFSGRYDVTARSLVEGRVGGERRHEFRQSANSDQSSIEPISIDILSAEIGAEQTFDQLRLRADADYRDFTHGTGVNELGAIVDQGERDRAEVEIAGRVDYALSPDTAFFARVSGNEIDYHNGAVEFSNNNGLLAGQPGFTLDRSSNGYDALVGASFDLTALVRGEISAGYLSQTFDTAASNGDDTLDGVDVNVDVDWFVSPLTTISFGAGRDIRESALTDSTGSLSTSGQLTVDHEWDVNLILSGQFDFRQDEYQGIDRTDDRFGISVGATYLMNERVGFDLELSRTEQQSGGVDNGRDFDVNAVQAGFRLAL